MKDKEVIGQILAAEVRHFFMLPWNLRLMAFVAAAVALALWRYTASPFVPLFAVVFAGLEAEYCNTLFRWPNEFKAFCLLPVSWRSIVFAKNLATITITLVCTMFYAAIVLYFAPVPPGIAEYRDAMLYLLSVLFPLLHAGNLQSVVHPRSRAGWQVDDLAGIVIMLGVTAIVSIPFLILVPLLHLPVLCLAYSAAMAFSWWHFSITGTAERIMRDKGGLCTLL